MMFLVPAIGSHNEEPLQDTLKSIFIALFALSGAMVFFWQIRKQETVVKFPWPLWLPLGLMVYALASMVWSHTYLAGVEAVRWFVLSLIFFLGSNTLTLERITTLAWGIHLGAVTASLWTALQFWFDFQLFAQGPNPASTFVNRNFFAEFLVCTLPFSVLLLTRIKDKTSVLFLTFSVGFNIAALMMTGTRSAIVALLILLILLPCVVLRYRKQVASSKWRAPHLFALAAILFTVVLGIGSIPTGNPSLKSEFGYDSSLARATKRAASMTNSSEYTDGSFSIRAVMWKATARMIAANPVLGVGAGAWEVKIPLYQAPGSQLETDYYAHNEFLQLLAEYGLIGWVFLIGLISYLLRAASKTWTNRFDTDQHEALPRALTLSSLLVFFLVSNAGFPWHMAVTGALFTLSLSILAASDLRLSSGTTRVDQSVRWNSNYSSLALFVIAVCLVLALYLSQRAIECEKMLVHAIKTAMSISHSRVPNDPRWDPAKTELLRLVDEGISINTHYRKLTPMVADALAGWGDWKNANRIWESVLSSRPYIVIMMANVARGYIQTGNYSKAQEYLERARSVQASAVTLDSLEVLLWSRTGRERDAAQRCKVLLHAGVIDRELLQTAFYLGHQLNDTDLAVLALELGIKTWPERAVDGWLKLGDIYASDASKNNDKALQSYSEALNVAPTAYKTSVLNMIPARYRAKLQ
jgi:O-antigen ligase